MKPSVLFVCVKNGGKSQMAAALMRHHGGDRVDVYSAGTKPGSSLNAESVATVEEIGASCDGEFPKPIDPNILSKVDKVIIIGREANLDEYGVQDKSERWETDEPSTRGIEGMERMALIRDDIDTRVRGLLSELLGSEPADNR